MVHTDQVRNLMDQMMKVNILNQSEKLRLLKDEEKTFPDPNVIMDTRHRILRENFSASSMNGSIGKETRRSLTQEDAMEIYMKNQQRFLEAQLRIFEAEVIKARPKFLKSNTCSRSNLAPSNDEDFWGTFEKVKTKVTLERRRVQSSCKESVDSFRKNALRQTDDCSLKVEDKKDLKTATYAVPHIGSIKVTIKDKVKIDTDAERLCLLRKYFNIFKQNIAEERRLRAIKMKIEQNMADKAMRKYFDIWKRVTRDAKSMTKEQGEEISEEEKIQIFINAITERQRELMKMKESEKKDGNFTVIINECSNRNMKRKSTSKRIIVESPAQSRLNAQKKIIEKQKIKLAEQSKIIEDLKLKEIRKEISKANNETVHIAKETLTYCEPKRRRTLIQLMHQNGYRDENLTVNRQLSDPPKFLTRMEARAKARRERIKLVEESRRQKLEDQKRRENDARMEEEQKKRRLQQEALAEVRKMKKVQEECRRREIEEFQKLNSTANEFYRKYLLRHYIIKPFVTLLEEKKINTENAEKHCREKILKKIFTVWRVEAKSQCKIKSEIALSFYNKNLVARTLEQWKQMLKEVNSKYQVAGDFYDMKLSDKFFKLWMARVVEVKVEFKQKIKLSDTVYEKKLKVHYFGKWKKYLTVADDIKESERRKDELRQLVQIVISDYNPKQCTSFAD